LLLLRVEVETIVFLALISLENNNKSDCEGGGESLFEAQQKQQLELFIFTINE
jgi:hypothetical protein